MVVAAASWWFMLVSEQAMSRMRGDGLVMDMMWAMMSPGDVLPYLLAAMVMWMVMMAAMMIPAILPVAMVYRGMHRDGPPGGATLLFAFGYLAGWLIFAGVAAVLQWWLHGSGWLHGHLLETGALGAGLLLVAAGLYQLTPLKEACLAHCRSPMGFLMAHWHDGRMGAFRMGLEHGVFCLGCCWVLMLLMFAGGAMSVAVMAALSVFILAERLLPAGPWVSRMPGFAMIAAGGWLALFA